MRDFVEIKDMCKESNTIMLMTQLVYPNGDVWEYNRLIEADSVKTMSEGMLKFFTDDLTSSLTTALKERNND